MLVKTSKGKEFEAEWIDEAPSGGLNMQLIETRRLPWVASQLDNLEWLERISEGEGNKRFEGFGRITSIIANRSGYLCRLERSDG